MDLYPLCLEFGYGAGTGEWVIVEQFGDERFRPLTRDIFTKIFTPNPKGGESDFAEFKQELDSGNIDIIKVLNAGHTPYSAWGERDEGQGSCLRNDH